MRVVSESSAAHGARPGRLRVVDCERVVAAIVEDPGCHFTAAPKWTVTDGFAGKRGRP